ncbi:MAG: hypothetical protein Q9218_001803 [Villophora microphyllina]
MSFLEAEDIVVLNPIYAYHQLYSIFALYGDTFLVVSPWGLYMANASPSVIHQIATRRTDWVKPIEHYSVVEQFGPNVVTTEGSTWRDHRKVSSGSFNEKSNAVVWKESIRQAQQMVKAWGRQDGSDEDGSMWVNDVYPDAATTSLHIISRSGFGVKLLWPGEELEEGDEEGGYERFSSHEPKGEYTMTFKEKRLPFKRTKKVWEGYVNFNDYLHELLELKKSAIRDGQAEKDSLDLMSEIHTLQFLTSNIIPHESLLLTGSTIQVPLIEATNTHTPNSNTNTPNEGDPIFTTPDILGNAFIFLFAGHETTANSITFLLIFLALNLPSQRRLQSTLDTLLPSPHSNQNFSEEWPYPTLFNKLGNSYLGACVNEQLRLIASVTMIPKRSVGPQTFVLDDGRTARVPGNTFQHFCTPSVHRNPKHWPHKPRSLRNATAENDLDDFVPERWLQGSDANQQTIESAKGRDNESGHKKTIDELNNDSAMDIGSASLFNPPRGAFIPFSHGPRACLGRRFAMVELVAVIATIMKDYSVELDTRDFESTSPRERMGKEEKKEVYGQAQERAWTILEKELGGLVTLQCTGRKVPLKFCRRGRERFGEV